MIASAGSILPFWNNEDIVNLPFIVPPQPTVGFTLADPDDLDRYNLKITSNLYRGLPDVLLPIEGMFLELSNKVYAMHQMLPSTLLPLHVDKYSYYKTSNNIEDVDSIVRIIVFLQDRKSGHILEVGDNLISNWKSGDWVSWIGSTQHLAANLGLENRYTLQITGHI